MSPQNALAFEIWRTLDCFGRGIDTFAGAPEPMRLEAIDAECAKAKDPSGMRWRVLLIEEKIYALRAERFRAEAERKRQKSQN